MKKEITELYKQELEKALLECSENRLDKTVAHEIATIYAKRQRENVIFSHISIRDLAKTLIDRIKPEYFIK